MTTVVIVVLNVTECVSTIRLQWAKGNTAVVIHILNSLVVTCTPSHHLKGLEMVS